MLKDHDCIFFIADLHTLTTSNGNGDIYKQSLETLATYLACGLDPKKNKFFLQSDNYYHPYFAWILSCITGIGELNRMVQMKDKSQKYDNVGVLTYPILMAADILLYNPDYVPVGQDQLQHLELTRDLAHRINKKIQKEIFKLPQPFKNHRYPTKIYNLKDPQKKMSKSDGSGCLFLNDTPDEIIKKIKKATTDSYPMPMIDEDFNGRHGIKNLINLYQCFTNEPMDKIIEQFQGKNISEFKNQLTQVALDHLLPLRTKIQSYMNDPKTLQDILYQGKQWSMEESKKTIEIMNNFYLNK
jgi:tryptophanyl-tRNA synthetase